jgi:ATP-dependent Lon protease
MDENAHIELPGELPVLPIKNGVVFPNLMVPLVLTTEASQELVDDALASDRLVATITQISPNQEQPGPDDLYEIGTASMLLRMLRTPEGVKVLVHGLSRIHVNRYSRTEPYLHAKIEEVIEPEVQGVEMEARIRNVLEMFQEIVGKSPQLPDELGTIAFNIREPGKLADFISSYMQFDIEVKQQVLETIDPLKRLEMLVPLLNKDLEVIRISSKIQDQVRTEIDKGQKEYILKEQLKAIQKELGIGDDRSVEIEELKRKINDADMPEETQKVAEKELDRLNRINPGSPEYTVVRTYMDWLVELPWNRTTKDNMNLRRAKKTLNEDHYDLQFVKDRILEFLAVRKLKNDTKGPILCFVGPPGVGKTSLGKSIARTMGRKFIRLSLGGTRDEAEIRGHRRTYVGALPGRIIQWIKQAGTRNPVFMLDEVDKLGSDFRGDPAAALLEVLDPEQNDSFSDHYLEVPFDLSDVFFITTANVTSTIPPPLLDRMELIELPGYVDEEKLQISKNYLVPRQKKENGLEKIDVRFDEKALLKIINDYTRESGVRNLERQIGTIMRKIAKDVASGKMKAKRIRVGPAKVEKFLGPPYFFSEVAERIGEVGVVTGLVWTPTGGDILFIEALKMRGEKGFLLTGQLGDVMKESAEAALSLVKSRAKELNIDPKFSEEYDIHLHVPVGAIPKDGPSAGVAIFTSLTSLMTGAPVDPDLAMTGEITLRGKVMPVGGIKEKIIAAKRAGIKRVVLPSWNKRDLEDVPGYIKKKLDFIFVDNVNDVLVAAFGDRPSLKQERREPVEAQRTGRAK